MWYNIDMNTLQAIILGIFQGLTEFLPVSSSAHISIVSRLLNIGDAGAAFTAIIQFGTQFAVVLYFRREIVRILVDWFRSLGIIAKKVLKLKNYNEQQKITAHAKMGWLIILGTLPIVVFGALLKHHIETSFRDIHITAVMLIVFGIVLCVSDIFSRHEYTLKDLKPKSAFLYGLAQSLALVPGVSRSGATISAGRLMGFNRTTAARFSFFLSIPSVFGAGLFELKDVFENFSVATSVGFPGWFATIIATIISFFIGYLVIATFMKVISRISLTPFAIYRILVGLLIFALF
ncbi:MAG: undecaprenyl-diphosphatase UppP [Candidatus Ancillula sp.]|nr:undecaprenyl-diphosphatase UppP [Candidatus Ancillula sp.]